MSNSEQKYLKRALEKLKKHGYKYTRKREAILTYLAQENRYLSAKEVYEFMENQYAGISYDTIYRNLRDFVDLALIEETDLQGEKKFRFHCCQDEHLHHHHFICTICGATKEIHMCPMNFFKEQLPNCEINGHRFEIYGVCESCVNQKLKVEQ